MNTLHLHIVERQRIDLLVLSFEQPFSEMMFILLFHLLNIANEGFVVDEFSQSFQRVESRDPIFADFLAEEAGEGGNLRGEMDFTSAMASLRLGLLRTNQRRGVMPLVLFWNLSGVNS